jgi:hypothetical protein
MGEQQRRVFFPISTTLFPNAISVLLNESSLSKSFERIGIRVTCRIRNLIGAASLPPGRKLEPGIEQADRRCNQKGKNESTLKHCAGNGGIVRVGADLAAAAYEDPRRATGAAADHNYVNNRH